MNESMRSFVGLFPRPILASIAVLLLAACVATPANPRRMTVPQASITSGFPASLQHAMCVRSVSGGEPTNPLWLSEVGNPELREALTTSLSNAGLLAPQNACKYFVDVNLLGLSRPTGGSKVNSHANYKVYDGAGNPILLETISASYTAGAFDAQLKHSTEGAIRVSISQFLDKLRNINIQPTRMPRL